MEEKKKKINLKILVPIIAIVIIIVGGIIFYNNSEISKDYYYFLQDGYYQKAYEKAKNDEEKNEIIQQNAIAYTCKKIFSTNYSLTLGTKLENAWYDKNKNIVLYLSNSDYPNTSNKVYVLFYYKEKEEDYEWVCLSKSPIFEQNISLSENYSSKAENAKYAAIGNSFFKQTFAKEMNEMMNKENEMQIRTIGNVNAYFNLGTLNSVTLFKPGK